MSAKPGEIVEGAEVIDAGAKGKNIARAGSFVLLVDNAVPGDLIDIKVFRKKKGLAEGSAVNFHRYSTDRVTAVCRHFNYCGGCTWQNISYEKQLFFKEKSVRDALQRIAHINDLPEITPIIGSPKTEYYRNRLDFGFSDKRWLYPDELNSEKENEPGLGFHVSGRFDKVLDIWRCYLQPDPSNQIRLAIREFALKNDYSFFDLRNQAGSLRSLIVRTAGTGEVMVILAFYSETDERVLSMMEFIRKRFPGITSLYYVINQKANDTLFDQEHVLFSGKQNIREHINGINYEVGPKSFFQTNSNQAVVLFQKAIEFAELTPTDVVFDLYTGVGSIALQAAKLASKVVGIEGVSEAIDYAKYNAKINNISNAEFFTGDVKAILNDDFVEQHGRPDVIITDPPRNGMEPQVVNKILSLAPERIVYVSCNAATQARDLEMLKETYQVTAIQPVDMFPHTYHVENICQLRRRI